MPRWTEWTLAAPGLFVAACTAAMLLAQALAPALIDGSSLTLSEAAALADQADVVRLLRRGADPSAPQRVRRRVLREIEQRMTPLEAAAAGTSGNRPAIMRMLLDAGGVINSRNYAVLWCLAERRQTFEVLAFLREHLPDEPVPACAGVRTPW